MAESLARLSDAKSMLAAMSPVLREGGFVFVTGDLDQHVAKALMAFREDEGLTLVIDVDYACEHGLTFSGVYACITLSVHSALDGVGLTAAVSHALAAAGVPCNMVAAYHHDHVFVPIDRADEAVRILEELSARAQ